VLRPSRPALLARAAIASLAIAACAEQGGAQRPEAPPSAPVLALGATAAPTAAPLLPGAPAPAPAGPAVFDPASLTLVLDDPRVAAAREAAAREDYAAAARELELALSGPSAPSADEAPLFRYQLGRLRALAGDPWSATAAFDGAAVPSFPLADYARYRSAALLVKLGKHDEALQRAQAIKDNPAIRDDLSLVLAEALAGKGDVDAAAPHFRAYLGKSAHPPDWIRVALRFARALLAAPSEEHAEEAIRLARRVLFEGEGGTGAGEARALEADALATLPFARRRPLETPSSAELVARARSLVESAQLREALRVTDAALASPEAARPGDLACEAWLARAEALGRLRRGEEGADAYGKADAACAGLPRRAKALFAGGRAAQKAGRPAEAVQRFAVLERDFADHSYADDARLHGARAARALGDRARFADMLSRLPDDYPSGDMVNDGLFELALSYMEERSWAAAIAPLERARQRSARERGPYAAGRLPYYLGRARLETGAVEQGLADLASVITDYPLSFYMTLAYARLAERDPARAERALEDALAREPASEAAVLEGAAFADPAFLRALLLAREEEVKLARGEIDELRARAGDAAADVVWAAALLLSKAGEAGAAHRLVRGAEPPADGSASRLSAYTLHYPVGPFRSAWEIAYPRPFSPVVAAEAARSRIPEPLAYAIMREESAFDPRVVSHAGAVGLMQLMVPTAKVVAKPLGLPHDRQSLKRPEVNVALGCRYLSVLRRKFEDNPLLAIPGYNAGGNAPARWIAERPSDDFDLWVERIPYEETRLYTKRVLGSMAVYEFLYGRDRPTEALRSPLAASPAARALGPSADARDERREPLTEPD
jgi:soluble lytic murein transglycosylase